MKRVGVRRVWLKFNVKLKFSFRFFVCAFFSGNTVSVKASSIPKFWLYVDCARACSGQSRDIHASLRIPSIVTNLKRLASSWKVIRQFLFLHSSFWSIFHCKHFSQVKLRFSRNFCWNIVERQSVQIAKFSINLNASCKEKQLPKMLNTIF